MKNKPTSLRSKLIKTIIKPIVYKIYYTTCPQATKIIQAELDKHLSFKTIVFEKSLTDSHNCYYGQITFQDENDISRCIDISIIPSNKL